MRRPGSINLEAYFAALDLQLRKEVHRLERRTLPGVFHRLARTIKSVMRPILQSAAVVLTSLAVIVTVGAAPASVRTPPPTNSLATPAEPVTAVTEDLHIRDRLPPDEFLAVESVAVQEADNPDAPPMEME